MRHIEAIAGREGRGGLSGPHTGARVLAQKKYERYFSHWRTGGVPDCQQELVRTNCPFHDLLLNHIHWLVETFEIS
jgi:hypothetical protein